MIDETFSSVDYVTQCLLDTERTELFKKAIFAQVKPGDIVLDSGTGSGILALFAAQAGAQKVIAFEIDPYIAKLAKENIARNKLDHVIEVVNSDIRNHHFEKGLVFNVVIMEMLTTGMIDEYQVWAVNNLHERGIVNADTVFIPFAQETKVQLISMDFSVSGFEMKMPIHTWKWLDDTAHRIDSYTEPQKLSILSFDKENSQFFSQEIEFPITKSGVINSVYFESITDLGGGISVGDTLALNGPVVIPLETDIEVLVGTTIKLKIEYYFGNGYRNLLIRII